MTTRLLVHAHRLLTDPRRSHSIVRRSVTSGVFSVQCGRQPLFHLRNELHLVYLRGKNNADIHAIERFRFSLEASNSPNTVRRTINCRRAGLVIGIQNGPTPLPEIGIQSGPTLAAFVPVTPVAWASLETEAKDADGVPVRRG